MPVKSDMDKSFASTSATNDSDDIESEDEERSVEFPLKDGLDIETLQHGTTFEFKEVEERSINSQCEIRLDNESVFGDEVQNYSKSELIACESDEESPFEKLAKSMFDISPQQDRSVLKMEIKPGFGVVLPSKDCFVTVDYNAYFDCCPEPFDSTYLRNQKESFMLGGSTSVLPGLSLGISTMKLDEKSQFLCSPEWAYGSMGCPPRIPSNATVLFEVKLHNYVEDPETEVLLEQLSLNERSEACAEKIIAASKVEKMKGNNLVKDMMFDKALACYFKGVRMLEYISYADEPQEKKGQRILLDLYLNLAFAYLRLKRYGGVVRYSREALKLDKNNTKALYRLGTAFSYLGEWNDADHYLLRALKNEPEDPLIRDSLNSLEQRKAEYEAGRLEFGKKCLGIHRSNCNLNSSQVNHKQIELNNRES